MVSRRLSADEAALWARVMAGVRPIGGHATLPLVLTSPAKAGAQLRSVALKALTPTLIDSATGARPAPGKGKVLSKDSAPAPVSAPKSSPRPPQNTLDGTWDKHLSRGLVSPDRTVDLHGHTLSSAHALLDHALDSAVRSGDRTILLVTGKPPRPESERPHARGAIRAAVGDWLGGSRHAADIAAVRAAHPRHGGAGALYIVLRKSRLPRKF